MNKPLYLIDGYSIIYRSYFAFIRNPIVNGKGENVSAIFGFFNTLFSIYRKFTPDLIMVAMDSRGPTFRHEIYDQYKANREKAPQDLHNQVKPIIDILGAMGIPVVKKEGLEADDLMGALALEQERKGGEAYIISGDKDLMQLVTDHIFMLKPDKSQFIKMGPREIMEEKGVRPDQIIDYLSLMGDASDNVPGVAGIGPKTAVKLLEQFGNLENLYDNLEKVSAKGQRQKLTENREEAFFSKTLVTIKTDVNLEDEVSLLRGERNDERVLELLSQCELNHISTEYKRLFLSDCTENIVPEDNPEERETYLSRKACYQPVLTLDELDQLLSDASSALFLAFDCETDNIDEMKATPLGFSFSFEPGSGYYIPIKHEGKRLPDENAIRERLQVFFDKGEFKLIGQNFKYDYKVLTRWGLRLPELYFDTMIAAWMLESDERVNMDSLALKYLNYETIHFKDIVTKGQTFDQADFDIAVNYAAEDSDITLQLFNVLKKELINRKLDKLYYDLEVPLVYVLARMEFNGIGVKKDELLAYGKELSLQLLDIEQKIYQLCGEEFNIRSTKELQRILFDVRSLPTGKRTKTGYSTDIKVLNDLARQDPVPELILEHRGLSKLISTYVDALARLVDNKGKIHTHFLQTGTATGRIASKDPNLQNIPVRDERGRMIRSAFIADGGHIFLSADYSQIELVVLAHLSGDPGLCHAFKNGQDVHKQTASLIFGTSPEAISSDERRIAKTINFGVMYGMSAFRLSNELKIPRKDAAAFIDAYFERYQSVRSFIDDTIAEAEKKGGVTTMMGRYRTIRGINSRNKTEKQGAERAAVNSRIQGSAADIVKKAMVELDLILMQRLPDCQMLLQVHDECIFQVPLDKVEEASQIIRETMENTVSLNIPLTVNIEKGRRWGEIH